MSGLLKNLYKPGLFDNGVFRVTEYSSVRNLKIPLFEYSHGVTLKTPNNSLPQSTPYIYLSYLLCTGKMRLQSSFNYLKLSNENSLIVKRGLHSYE